MDISRNLFATGPASADETERLKIARALENRNFLLQTFHVNEDFMQLATEVVSGSHFDSEHHAGKLLLRTLGKHPDYIKLADALNLHEDHWIMVLSNGEVYATYEEIGSTGIYIHYTIITDELYEIESLRADIELLSATAWRTGGIISSSATIPLRNWLAFKEIDTPQDNTGIANLIDCLNFNMPAAPKFGNYWGISEATQDVALIVEPEQYPVIMQEVRKLMADLGRHAEPLINYLTDVLLEKWSGALVQEDPRLAWEHLMKTNGAQRFAQTCFDALQTQGTGQTMTEVARSRLLLAAVVLDLDMGSEERVESHRGLRYAPLYVHESPAQARTRLKDHFEQINRASPFAALLAVELVLAGQSPEFLVVTPPALQISSPGWVMLRKAVMLTERIAPGLSLKLSYDQLMKFAALAPLSDAQRSLHQVINLQCVMEWANINELTPRDDAALSVEQVATAAMNHYTTYANELEDALKAITAAPVSRRKLARQTLFDAGIDSHQEVFSAPDLFSDTRSDAGIGNQFEDLSSLLDPGGPFSDTLINTYLASQLHRKNLTSKSSKRNLHDVHPGLASLAPINQLYAEKLKPQHENFKSGISTMIRLAFSSLPMSDREALTQGASTLYLVRGNRNIAGHSADHFSPHGVVILCRFKSKNHCFELFPLQGLCRKSDRLAEAYFNAPPFNESTGEFDETTNEETGKFPRLTYLEGIITEHDAYFRGATPHQSEQADINKLLPRQHWRLEEYAHISEFGMLLDRFGEFAEHDEHARWYISPMDSFYSPRLKNIADFIAQENPPITYDEFYRLGYDQTEYEEKQEEFKRIANIVLNIFIPFRGCIQQLTSKDPEQRSGAAFTCIIDTLAVAFVFIGAAGALAKAVASSTKLLSLGRVAGRILVSIFNPLDGVPQLVIGAGKLAGRGVLKLSHYGSSISKSGARQLRRLTNTGSGSYDLVKALSKTGAASEIRMTLPTVAHARALFKDDALETVEQIVARLSQDVVSVPKGTNTTELQHLFNNATREATQSSKGFRELESLIGHAAANDVLIAFTKSRGPRFNGTKFTTNAHDYSETLGHLAELETKKINYLKNHQQNVLKLDLGKPPYTDVMPESAFNPQGFTDNAQRAGAWMVKGSTSDNELEHIVAILREYSVNNKSLTDATVVKEIHSRLVPQLAGTVRNAGGPSKYGGSISGFALLEQHLKKLDAAHEHFDKHLLAAIAGFQGFGDGNGRTASAVYSISQLRNNRFVPMPKHVFMSLSDLG
ncbi:hypothetical protein KW846_18275 [Pseudomonas sp. PDM32]|uniref:hypothetical protein n=1 Tax=Pseudomonas sp. PDM32 TaxID=2854768 RepID=UPI001C47F7B8|nr:hypothetical protein [Pseudomonas sp. PDM32]MBV7574655.1 hypothetical protein [Pseudomonas sp. PDM32]